MKKLVILLALLLSCMIIHAQEKKSKVTLKNGTELVGVIKSLDPMTGIVLSIAGIDSTIPMDKVDRVEEVVSHPTNSTSEQRAEAPAASAAVPTSQNPLIVTDNAEYPETVDVEINGRKFTFVLVRGGTYLMGYDGRGSRSMKSEPIHQVNITSFYMCTELLSDAFVNTLNIKGVKVKEKEKPFLENKRDVLNSIVSKCNETSNYTFRLPTEAEWEYAARSTVKGQLFEGSSTVEACSDFYSEYTDFSVETDPTGPRVGRRYVVRQPYVYRQYLPFNRSLSSAGFVHDAAVRLTIKAKDFIK